MPIYLKFYFWLVLISALCFAFERLAPWRKKQPALRDDIVQDAFWLFFNTNFVGWMVAVGALKLLAWNAQRLLHTVSFPWKFHTLHHSITEPDSFSTFPSH